LISITSYCTHHKHKGITDSSAAQDDDQDQVDQHDDIGDLDACIRSGTIKGAGAFQI
jgi:hypothetical protein